MITLCSGKLGLHVESSRLDYCLIKSSFCDPSVLISVILDNRRRTKLMISTILNIEKIKRRSAIMFGLKALQKLSDRCGTGSLAGWGYRIVVNI